MANQPKFETEDVERLFRALLPTNRPDPFGEIETRLLALGEALIEGDEETLEWRAKVAEELDDIKNRTFGIMVLQIFRTMKFFFGLLPQGRIILLLIAGMGLATTLLQGERPSISDIRSAVEGTGIGNFINNILEEIQRVVGEVTVQAKETGDELQRIFNAQTSDLTFIETEIGGAIRQLETALQQAPADLLPANRPLETARAVDFDRVQDALQGLLAITPILDQLGNVASNAALFTPSILRTLEDRIRGIPELAGRLVSL